MAFHKACLGYVGLMAASGPRGRWLCYFCKVVKFGIACEPSLETSPAEETPIREAQLHQKRSWQDICIGFCDILLAYRCSAKFAARIRQVKDLIGARESLPESSSLILNFAAFVHAMLQAVPSEGDQQSFHVLNLFNKLRTYEGWSSHLI